MPTPARGTRSAVTIKDVAEFPLILPPQHLTTWRVVDFVFHKYGLNYRVALEAGGWLVSDTVNLEIEVEAMRRAETVAA